jgi:hypothetical protein
MTQVVWVILARGFFVAAYSSRDKAQNALTELTKRGIVSAGWISSWKLDQEVNS